MGDRSGSDASTLNRPHAIPYRTSLLRWLGAPMGHGGRRGTPAVRVVERSSSRHGRLVSESDSCAVEASSSAQARHTQ
jgi:hypothetical protein